MTKKDIQRLFFVINSVSGSNTNNWEAIITDYFTQTPHIVELFSLSKNTSIQQIKDKILTFKPNQVIAVGGDGTVKFVAECLMGSKIVLGILPAGSANGLARELGISEDHKTALSIITDGKNQEIHTTTVNQQLCIHLSDIGLNAYLMKRFEQKGGRGMWGYFLASLKVFLQNSPMQLEMHIDNKQVMKSAFMVVIANATMYGTGAVINPIGKLDDDLFEVVIIKKRSLLEVFKMVFTHEKYDEDKTEIFHTNQLTIKSRKKVHFQIDGEYLGKVKEVIAEINPKSLVIRIPN
ncbi:YegS/Rv2252/BmrU family lipid kinase [Arcicella sp. LKC2W]|uniref:diacylglycerol/lipid kinase family protein n=1 Tax=Arcicella sp. LKC2W TaxID=2984198 RepID=UPI002B1F2641|nr:YegS/Rv2252/BmrU family lipid kinase [Arcicella sp. LKC2W]MEA5460943.1 YegS/Rv2252/BmrU family lipid kinase [Arcicella sp. LKC2W]